MNRFEKTLWDIHEEIVPSQQDVQVYAKDFEIIRDFVLRNMQQADEDFKKFFGGTLLFGSVRNKVCINKPEEFDIIFILRFKNWRKIRVSPSTHFPGFVQINVADAITDEDDVPDLITDDKYFINRHWLKNWIGIVFENAFEKYGCKVTGSRGDQYELIYSVRGLAHTIYAKCGKNRHISIDFVPAIEVTAPQWMSHRMRNDKKAYLVPKPSGRGPYRKRAFMMCFPNVEYEFLHNKQHLKVVQRLLKAIKNRYAMLKCKSYFFTALLLWEIDNQDADYWRNPLYVILTDMVEAMAKYFEERCLPFYWYPQLNLFGNLSDEELLSYAQRWRSIHNRFKNYHHQDNISIDTIRKHFIKIDI